MAYPPREFEVTDSTAIHLPDREFGPNALIVATGFALLDFHGQVDNGWTRDTCEFLVPQNVYGYPIKVKEFWDGLAIASPATYWFPGTPTGCGVDWALVDGVDNNTHMLFRALTVLYGRNSALLRLSFQVTARATVDEWVWSGTG